MDAADFQQANDKNHQSGNEANRRFEEIQAHWLNLSKNPEQHKLLRVESVEQRHQTATPTKKAGLEADRPGTEAADLESSDRWDGPDQGPAPRD